MDVKGVGMVFVEYEAEGSASSARAAMHGRKFGGNTVVATFFPGQAVVTVVVIRRTSTVYADMNFL
eukprot:scaffold293_cov267-Prasinococcus_capsulatus_cf.AAC.18